MNRIILNGQSLAADQPQISAGDRGLTLGDGVFETLLVRAGRVVDLDAHLDRLASALALLGFPPLEGVRAPRRNLDQALAANTISDGVLRLTVTRGTGLRGLAPAGTVAPTVLVSPSALPVRPSGFSAIIASRTRRNEHSPISRIKALGYLDHILAIEEAGRAGADDAILLNGAGRVACFTVANLIMRQGDRIITPPVGDGLLPGTMRRHLIRQLGIAERSITPSDLASADEVIAVNSLSIRRMLSLDGGTWGSSHPNGGDRLFQAALAVHQSL